MFKGRLAGKKILVTGGSRGIGRALVKGFAKEGADVVFTYRKNTEAAISLCAELSDAGFKVEKLSIDAYMNGAAELTIQRSLKILGTLDVLVNNIGIVTRNMFVDITRCELDRVMGVNFIYPFLLTQKFCQYCESKAAGDTRLNKSIINISSLSAERAVSRVTHYQCSKAALSMLTRSVAFEMARFGVRANTIAPGLTETEGNVSQRSGDQSVWKSRVSHIPIGRAARTEDHVGAAIYLASDESTCVTGATITIDGGQSTI